MLNAIVAFAIAAAAGFVILAIGAAIFGFTRAMIERIIGRRIWS